MVMMIVVLLVVIAAAHAKCKWNSMNEAPKQEGEPLVLRQGEPSDEVKRSRRESKQSWSHNLAGPQILVAQNLVNRVNSECARSEQ